MVMMTVKGCKCTVVQTGDKNGQVEIQSENLFSLCSGGATAWRSKQQPVAAQSSEKAEFVALALCVRDVLWRKKFKGMPKEIIAVRKMKKLFDIFIGEDNQACIAIAQSPVLSDKIKHIYFKYQILIDNVRNGQETLQYIPTERTVANFLTENLSEQKFGPFGEDGWNCLSS